MRARCRPRARAQPQRVPSRLLRVVPEEADEDREDHAADRAAGDISDPALDRLSHHRADELTDDAAADRACNRVAERAERIVLGRGACGATAYRARNDLNEKTGEIHVHSSLVSAFCPA